MPDSPLTAAEKETTRLEAFSDGVFGVAITLLAIEIGVKANVPDNDQSLRQSLLALWPQYVAYLASFVQILFMWMAHHAIFKLVRRINIELMLANGLLLALVVLVPFPTRTLGEFLHSEARHTAVVFYTGYFVFISLAFNLLTGVVASRHHGLTAPGLVPAAVVGLVRSQRVGLLCNLIITGTAFLSIWLALGLSTAMWVYWARLSARVEARAVD